MQLYTMQFPEGMDISKLVKLHKFQNVKEAVKEDRYLEAEIQEYPHIPGQVSEDLFPATRIEGEE